MTHAPSDRALMLFGPTDFPARTLGEIKRQIGEGKGISFALPEGWQMCAIAPIATAPQPTEPLINLPRVWWGVLPPAESQFITTTASGTIPLSEDPQVAQARGDSSRRTRPRQSIT